MKPKKTPLPYQLEKLAAWDARNSDELAAIRAIAPSKVRAREVALRVRRLKKSVRDAQRYCDEIGHERAPLEHHENGDGQ